MRKAFVVAFAFVAWGIVLLGSYDYAQAQKKTPPPVVVIQTPPEPAQALFDGSVRRALLKGIVKRGVERKLTSEGFKSVGGSDKALTDAEFDKLWAKYEELNKDGKLFDSMVKEASPKAFGAIGEGGFLANLLEWIRTHPEEVAAIIKLILTLLALL